MSTLLSDIVCFRGDKLFNGAVNIDWIVTDEVKASLASSNFVFHGPAYHGVSQADVGLSHGHRLQDTASFAKTIFSQCYGLDEQPFTLAIAGYGTGKSHFALTLARLLNDPVSPEAQAILTNIAEADLDSASSIKFITLETKKPCLVISINGMRNIDLLSEVSKQIIQQAKKYGLNTTPIDDLRPRFKQAQSLLKIATGNSEVVAELLDLCDLTDIQEIFTKLEEKDDAIYSKVYKLLASRGIPITALGGESIRDVIDVAAYEYCGVDKPFRSIVILFDEFGRYTEFATTKSHIAGSGVLQDMFEAVQANSSLVSFIGFIQFELNAYVQRVAPEHQNEIKRYVTRYQNANKVYLSTNLETLIASLLEKRDINTIDSLFDNETSRKESEQYSYALTTYFPAAKNYSNWKNPDQFHKIIRKGCWPLSPYAVWLLFHFAAAGKHLQERSALSLLAETFNRYSNYLVKNNEDLLLSPVDLWSDALQQELITSEEGGLQGAIAHSYVSIIANRASQLSELHTQMLKAIVLASKLNMKVKSQSDAIKALSLLAGVDEILAKEALNDLREEHNTVEWDESSKHFDLLGDSVPRNQFLRYIRNKVASSFDERTKALLFAEKAIEWCPLVKDINCDFADRSRISTQEWFYKATTSQYEALDLHVKSAVADLIQYTRSINDPRGRIIYCYVGQERDIDSVERDASRLLRNTFKDYKVQHLPVIIILFHDEDGKLGQSFAELSIVKNSIPNQDKVKFGENLINAHKEKMEKEIESRIETMMLQRLYITSFKDTLESRRIGQIASEIFTKIYKSAIPFPFDGFKTLGGNAAKTNYTFTTELLQNRLDWNSVQAKPKQDQNRATTLFLDTWGIFAQNGSVRKRPENTIVKSFTEKWDELLETNDKNLVVSDAINILCAPPYGANIASAGLVLGVFVAHRYEKLSIMKGERLISTTDWIKDGLFKSNFIDISKLEHVKFVPSGESVSEWENLLADWEQAVTNRSLREIHEKSKELLTKIPRPASLEAQARVLERRSEEARRDFEKNENDQDSCISKIISGETQLDVNLLAWGACKLIKLISRMKSENNYWSEDEMMALQPHVENSRVLIVNIFPEWLEKQTLRNSKGLEDFKTSMMRVLDNLQQLRLGKEEIELLKEHIKTETARAEKIKEARGLLENAKQWLSQNEQVFCNTRVLTLRELHRLGRTHATKLQGCTENLPKADTDKALLRFQDILSEIKKTIDVIKKRAEDLWSTSICTRYDIERLQDEVTELLNLYEGCEKDVNDFQIMRRALRKYYDTYKQLHNDAISSVEFDELSKKLSNELIEELGDEELPWPPEETFHTFKSRIEKERFEKSFSWIDSLATELENIEKKAINEIMALQNRSQRPPAIIAHEHQKQLEGIQQTLETHLNTQKVERLVAEVKALSPEMRRDFFMRLEV